METQQKQPRAGTRRPVAGYWPAVLLTLALVGALLTPVTLQAASVEQEFWEQMQIQARGGDRLAATAAMVELHSMESWFLPDVLRATYQGIHEGASRLEVRRLAAERLIALEHQWGNREVSNALARQQGYVLAWSLIGPFANDGMGAFNTPLPPETRGITEEPLDGKVMPIHWRELHDATVAAYLPISELALPSGASLAYIATTCRARRGADAMLDLAIIGGYRAWLNGQPVARVEENLGGSYSRDQIRVRLAAGENSLVLKVVTVDEVTGVFARFLNPDGTPLPMDCEAARQIPRLVEGAEWPVPQHPADRIRETLGEPSEAPARDLANAARIVQWLQPRDRNRPWIAWAQQAQALSAGQRLEPLTLLRIAAALDHAWQKEHVLRQAVGPGSALAASRHALVRLELFGEHGILQALQRLEELSQDSPRSWLAELTMAESFRSAGFGAAGLARANALLEETGPVPAVLGAVLEMSRDMGQHQASAELLTRLLESDIWSAERHRELLVLLRLQGRHDQADAWMQRLEESLPSSPWVHSLLSQLHWAAGDFEESAASLERALSLAPGDPALWRLKANQALETGDPDTAISALEQLLVIRPQDNTARELLAEITPQADSFHIPYRLSDEEILALRLPHSDSHAADFSFLSDRSVTHVWSNGLSARYEQTALQAHTRGGADAVRSQTLNYVPSSERLQILGARVIKPSGEVLDTISTSERGPSSGATGLYYDSHFRTVWFQSVEPGDVVILETLRTATVARNLFDDYFGSVSWISGFSPVRQVDHFLLVPPGRQLYVREIERGRWSESRTESGETLLHFHASEIPATPRESMAPGYTERNDYIAVSTWDNWDDLASWYWHLIEEQLVSTSAIDQVVDELVEGVEDTEERVRLVYEWVVRNIRYVGLEFGIHGFKPYRVPDIFARRYGDCKDTASLMKVMLGRAGVHASIILIRTRDLGRIESFPPNLELFNHAIVYVPELDRYLDGTSGFSSAYELVWPDQGASLVEILDGNGGDFRESTVMPADQSMDRLTVSVDLRSERPVVQVERILTGSKASGQRAALEAEHGRRERVERDLQRFARGLALHEVQVEGASQLGQEVRIHAELSGGEWLRERGGHSELLPIGQWASWTGRYASNDSRQFPLDTGYAFGEEYRFRVQLPEGWAPASLPADLQVDSEFGMFSRSHRFHDGVLESIVTVRLDRLRVLPSEYQEFRLFLQEMDRELERGIRLVGGAQ